MAKKKTEKEEEKVEKKTTKKSNSKLAKFTLKQLFEKSELKESEIKEILSLNGLTSIEDFDVKLTNEEFEEVIKDYSSKRL